MQKRPNQASPGYSIRTWTEWLELGQVDGEQQPVPVEAYIEQPQVGTSLAPRLAPPAASQSSKPRGLDLHGPAREIDFHPRRRVAAGLMQVPSPSIPGAASGLSSTGKWWSTACHASTSASGERSAAPRENESNSTRLPPEHSSLVQG